MEVIVEEENPLETLWSQVSQKQLVLDKIVDYVIHHNEEVLRDEVCSTRLVNRQWLATTNKLLRAQPPQVVFKIPLTRENSTSGTPYVQQHGKVLDQFASSSMLHEDKCVPLFSFNASPDFFQHHDNHQGLLDCLTQYGGNVVELQLTLDTDRNLKPLNPGTWLPSLRSLSVGTTHGYCAVPLSVFARSVFAASPQLTAINLKRLRLFTEELNKFVVPTSITDISLSDPMLGYGLQVLAKSPLPNLKRLKLQGGTRSDTPQLLFNVLQKVSKTLEQLSLCQGEVFSHIVDLRMPFMEKLEILRIEMDALRLEERHAPLQRLLPSLKHLTLSRYLKFNDLLRSSHFDSVTSLAVSSYCPRSSYADYIDVGGIARTFPNLAKLNMTIEGAAAGVLRKSWHRLDGLQELRIRLFCKNPPISNHNSWDEILTGYSMDQLKALDKSPSTVLEETRYTSITALTGLETLHLESVKKYDIPLISDAAFKFAFLRMSKLSKLILSSDFSASAEMKETWEKQGTVIGIQRQLIVDADK